jgi:hypothetical protein
MRTIASGQVAFRNEAPFADTLSRLAKLLNIGLGAVVYPVTRPCIAAYDVEIAEAVVACALLWREPFHKQGQCPHLCFGAECCAGTRPHGQ